MRIPSNKQQMKKKLEMLIQILSLSSYIFQVFGFTGFPGSQEVTSQITESTYTIRFIKGEAYDDLAKKDTFAKSVAECGSICNKWFITDHSCNSFQYSKESNQCKIGNVTSDMITYSGPDVHSDVFVRTEVYAECPVSHPYAYANGSECCKTNLEYPGYGFWPSTGGKGILEYNSSSCSSYRVPEDELTSRPCPSSKCMNYQNKYYQCTMDDVILGGVPGG